MMKVMMMMTAGCAHLVVSNLSNPHPLRCVGHNSLHPLQTAWNVTILEQVKCHIIGTHNIDIFSTLNFRFSRSCGIFWLKRPKHWKPDRCPRKSDECKFMQQCLGFWWVYPLLEIASEFRGGNLDITICDANRELIWTSRLTKRLLMTISHLTKRINQINFERTGECERFV